MRVQPTASEAALWRELSGSKLGVLFRRQIPLLGRYIADFYTTHGRLVVEIDGKCHQLRMRADARRDAALLRAKYRVLRLPAELVLRALPEAVALVRSRLGE
jgi:very-short-patch-repair endonuclease